MSQTVTILVVDDEPAIRRLFHVGLSRAGYAVVEASTAREALNAMDIDKPEVVLLDLGLPDRDGLELIPLMRGQAAIIVVSAREATDQKVAALDLGADDFVAKPFDSEEVLARIRTALRRRIPADLVERPFRRGDVEIDLVARLVRKGGAEVHLTPKEYAFLAELARNAGRVITHAQLLRAVWGPGHESDVEYLRVAARGIRRKLEDNPASPSLIRNEPGVGYRLVSQD
jgi:two-component system KDP operon response regulator KdpE